MNIQQRVRVGDAEPARSPDDLSGTARSTSHGISKGTWIVIALAALAAIGIAAWFLTRGGDEAVAADAGSASVPTVSVIVPGLSEVTADVRVTGSVGAQRDLPVGVQGQGGMVMSVLVDEGDYVREGQVLARIDKSVQSQQVAQLRAGVAQADADAALAQSELERAEALVERGFISTADIERRTAERDSARARVNVARAQLRAAEAQLAQLDVRAPESGLILERRVEEGQVVSPGSGALFRIAEDGQMELRANVAEADLRGLTVGQNADVQLTGSPTAYKGRVWMVSPIIDPTTRQGEARILISGDQQVRPGAFATGLIETGTAERPVLPESAVFGGVDDAFVFIVDDENNVSRRTIVTGPVNASGVTIVDGLSGEERVVMSAGAFLNDGDPVEPRLVDGEES
ncbi:MAG: efflux RND transporter periplasmic adaptor subunit [Pacificimonas sp.]